MKIVSRLHTALLLLIALLLWSSGATAFPLKSEIRPYGENVVAQGYARNRKATVLYYESYLDNPMSSTIRASYWDNNRRPIAYKELNFGNSFSVPDNFIFIDYRRWRGYRITVTGDIANVKVLKVTPDGTETIRLEKNLRIDSHTVIDAAFHRFVVGNWKRLTSGKTVRIDFLQIDMARLVPLKMRSIRCDTAGTECFEISFDNLLLQSLVPKIRLTYDAATKNLLRYTGIGPVTRQNGKSLEVDIQYKYP